MLDAHILLSPSSYMKLRDTGRISDSVDASILQKKNGVLETRR